MTIEAAIKRHAVLIYFVLVFLLSGGSILLIVGPEGFPLKAEEFASFGLSLYAAILAGPCVAGVLMTAIVDGRPGLRHLFARLRRWRIGWTWYAIALLPALLMTATALLLSLVSPDFRPAILDSNGKSGTLLGALGPALLVGCFERDRLDGVRSPSVAVTPFHTRDRADGRTRVGRMALSPVLAARQFFWGAPPRHPTDDAVLLAATVPRAPGLGA